MGDIATLNVSRDQIEADLRAGKSVEQIAEDWSEPRANVYAIKRALDAASSAAPSPTATVAASPPRPRVVPNPTSAPAQEAPPGDLTSLVEEASRSTKKATRRLGGQLDRLVEDLTERLAAERRDVAERAAKQRAREAALAEVQALEEQLRAAKSRLGGARTPANPSRSRPGHKGGVSTRAAYEGGPPPSVIRAWARERAVECPSHGMVPQRVIAAYRAAVGE